MQVAVVEIPTYSQSEKTRRIFRSRRGRVLPEKARMGSFLRIALEGTRAVNRSLGVELPMKSGRKAPGTE